MMFSSFVVFTAVFSVLLLYNYCNRFLTVALLVIWVLGDMYIIKIIQQKWVIYSLKCGMSGIQKSIEKENRNRAMG